MRKLKIIEHISLDGVIQAPGGPNEDGDYPFGEWTLPYRDPAAGKALLAAHSEPFDLLLGRRCYIRKFKSPDFSRPFPESNGGRAAGL